MAMRASPQPDSGRSPAHPPTPTGAFMLGQSVERLLSVYDIRTDRPEVPVLHGPSILDVSHCAIDAAMHCIRAVVGRRRAVSLRGSGAGTRLTPDDDASSTDPTSAQAPANS